MTAADFDKGLQNKLRSQIRAGIDATRSPVPAGKPLAREARTMKTPSSAGLAFVPWRTMSP
ncbi:hypothetical protein [Burkholderia anthina]|uniref:hypothetical protein n=1 Tax=Burkholderia anthina TaxID=179879 RepID=UPI0015886C82